MLIVAEAMHESGTADVQALTGTVAAEIAAVWSVTVQTGFLRPDQSTFRPSLVPPDDVRA